MFLDKNVKVILTDGTIKKAGELACGDLLMDEDGNSNKIVYLSNKTEKVLDLNISSRDEQICVGISCPLKFKRKYNPKRKVQRNLEMRLVDYLKRSVYFKSLMNFTRTNQVFFREKQLQYSPYFVGLFIPNSTFEKKNLTLLIEEWKIFKFLRFYCDEQGISYKFEDAKKHRTIKFILDDKKALDFFSKIITLKKSNRRIDKEYLLSSVEQRKKLLGGIIDSCANFSGMYCNFMFDSKKLLEDLQFLCYSLGMLGKTRENYPLSLYGNVNRVKTLKSRDKFKPLYTKNMFLHKFYTENPRYKEVVVFFTENNGTYLLDDFTLMPTYTQESYRSLERQ